MLYTCSLHFLSCHRRLGSPWASLDEDGDRGCWTAYSIDRSWRTAGQTTYQRSLVPHTHQTDNGRLHCTGNTQGQPYASHSGVYNAALPLFPLVTFASSSFALCRVVAAMSFTLTLSLPLMTQGIHDSPVPADTTSMPAPPMRVTLYPCLLTASWKFPCGLPSKPLQCQT